MKLINIFKKLINSSKGDLFDTLLPRKGCHAIVTQCLLYCLVLIGNDLEKSQSGGVLQKE